MNKLPKIFVEYNFKYKQLSRQQKPIWIRNQIQSLGPSYIKIGQFLSSRSSMIGKNKILKEALDMLRDNVEPVAWSELTNLVDETLFKEVDRAPLASASIGQVHKCLTLDDKCVVIKMRKPFIIDQINKDVMFYTNILQMLQLCKIGDMNAIREFIDILNNLKNSIVNECDLENEVRNLEKVRSLNLTKVKIPKVYPNLSTEDVIVMEYVPNIKMTEAYYGNVENNKKLSNKIMGLFVEQFIFHGVIHADPHLGNFALLPDKSKFVMYDFGHIIEFDKSTMNYMKLFIFEIMNGNVDNLINIIKQVPHLITIINEQQLRVYIKEYIRYIQTIDITVLKDLTKNDKSNLPFKFSGQIYELIRSFGIVEGICLEINPEFSYSEVFNLYIDQLFNDADFIYMKSNMDMNNLIDML